MFDRQDFEINDPEEPLGKGGFGIVYDGKLKKNNIDVAIKWSTIENFNKENLEKLENVKKEIIFM